MKKNKTKFRITLIPLILANLVPLYGVVALGWGMFDIFIVYWIETAVVGLYNILKIIRVVGFFTGLIMEFQHFSTFCLENY